MDKKWNKKRSGTVSRVLALMLCCVFLCGSFIPGGAYATAAETATATPAPIETEITQTGGVIGVVETPQTPEPDNSISPVIETEITAVPLAAATETVVTPTPVTDEAMEESDAADAQGTATPVPATAVPDSNMPDGETETSVETEFSTNEPESVSTEMETEGAQTENTTEETVTETDTEVTTSAEETKTDAVPVSFDCEKAVSGAGYIVTVKYTESAGIPEDAVLSVEELSGADYENCLTSVQATLGEGQVLSTARFFNIRFLYNGEEVQPAAGGTVSVNIAFTDGTSLTDGSQYDVVRVNNGAVDVIGISDMTASGISFVADSASVFGVVGVSEAETEAETETSFFDALMAAESCEAIFNLMMADTDACLELTADQLTQLEEKVNAMEDDGYKADVLDTIDYLRNPNGSGATTFADPDYTMQVGDLLSISTSTNSSTWQVIDSNGNVVNTITVEAEGSGTSRTLTVVATASAEVGTYTIQYGTSTGGSGSNRPGSGGSTSYTDAYSIQVTEATGTYKVYVYVSTSLSDECLELLGIDKDTVDGNNYFPVGEIYIQKSMILSKGNAATTEGSALINSANDWSAVLAALGELNTQTLVDENGVPYSNNKGNVVGDYLDKAIGDLNASWGSQQTALFRWNMTENYGFEDETVLYHLDLRFDTREITFITGNNSITNEPGANDGTTVDSRVYITGSEILEPRNLYIPDGYKFAGYYEDADFTTPWDGIGTPLNENQTVYIKIVPKIQVVIWYKVAEGEGSLSSYSEGVYEDAATAVGSTATASEDWIFDGWYADEACTQKLSDSATYVPAKPDTGWVETTYWAKFIPASHSLIITKTVAGGFGDRNKEFSFTVTSDKAMSVAENSGVKLSDDKLTASFNLKHNGTVTINVPAGAAVKVTENDATDYDFSLMDGSSVADNVTTDSYAVDFTMPATDATVNIKNFKDAIPDTGVIVETLPYVLILAIVVVGAVLFLKKRRNRDDD